MRSSKLEGPLFVGMSNGYQGHPADTPVRTVTPVWTKYWYNSYSKRAKPANPVTQPTNVQAYHWQHTRGVWSDSYGNVSPSMYPASRVVAPADVSDNVKNEAIGKLLSKLKGETWNLSTFIGEMPETMKFTSEVLSSLWKSYRAVRRGDLRALNRMWFPRYKGNRYRGRDAKRITDSYWNVVGKPSISSAADKWMAWRYAVSPMVYDLDDALKELYGRSQAAVIYRNVRGKATGVHHQITPGNVIRSGSVALVWRASLYYQVSPTTDAFKRLGLINLPATLWELAPLSFVVDWFIPFGRYLSHLDAAAGVTIVSQTLACTETSVESTSGSGGTVNYRWSITSDEFLQKTYTRWTTFSLSPPPIRFSPNLNLLRQFDAAALAFQTVTGRKR